MNGYASSVFLVFVATVLVCGFARGEDLISVIENRNFLKQTVWKQEVEAQNHEETFIELWDNLRKSDTPLAVLKEFDFGTLTIGELGVSVQELEHEIKLSSTDGPEIELDALKWQGWVDAMEAKGYRLFQSEWHHSRFDANPSGNASSVVSIVLHVYNEKDLSRYMIEGKIDVVWKREKNAQGRYTPLKIDASNLQVLERKGQPFFMEAFNFDIPKRGEGAILSYDLNQDNLPEIILPGINLVLWNIGEKGYGGKPMSETAFVSTKASVLGDFDNDGAVDYLCFGEAELIKGQGPQAGFYLLRGGLGGAFASKPVRIAIEGEIDAINGIASIAAGDIDLDGDLDVWISQYKATYVNGSMPTPYFDANDGYPAYLLMNDGNGSRFTESTEAMGLAGKRHRRTYSNSFYDYDGDNDLDLVVVSDFSGVDLHQNDGKGNFKDVTSEAVDHRSLFGMAHTFGDFNRDGMVDIYVTGMSSTTASRLDSMDANHEEFPDRNRMRIPMTYGNRLYLNGETGKLSQAKNSSDLARTGWAWGTATLDFDNDGDLDVYVANGHFSGESAKDYCSNFWTDDIYRGSSNDNPILDEYFKQSVMPMMEGNMSWNGFEHNFLFCQMPDGQYRNISFLMGVADELDSRRVISEDMNGDGLMDIVLSQLNYREDKDSSWIKIYRNVSGSEGNWIGVNISDGPDQPSPLGAKILVVDSNGEKRIDTVVSGDSFQAQHSAIKHFGLGKAAGVDYFEVTWPGGKSIRVDNPKPKKYHSVR